MLTTKSSSFQIVADSLELKDRRFNREHVALFSRKITPVQFEISILRSHRRAIACMHIADFLSMIFFSESLPSHCSKNNYTCSVIIPFYRRHEIIYNAVASALKLPFIEEIIIVDDDSDSDLNYSFFGNLFNEIAITKIKIIKNTVRKGAQGARVCGAHYSKSDLLLFLDSDDELIESGCIALYEELCSSLQLALVYGNILYGREYASDFLRLEGFAFDIVLKNLSLCPFSGLMVRKSMVCWDALNLELPAWQDDDFVLTVSLKYPIKFVDILSAKMHLSNDSISRSKSKQLNGLSILLKKWKSEIVSRQGFYRLFLWRCRQLILLLQVLSDWFIADSKNIFWIYFLKLLCSKLLRRIAGQLLKMISPFFDRIYT